MKTLTSFHTQKNKISISLTLLFLLLVGCTGKQAPTPAMPTPESIPTATAVESPAPTATFLAQTPTELPGGSQTDCVQVLPEAPRGKTYPGLVLFFNPEAKRYELFDFESGVKKVFPDKGDPASISPDRKSFALGNWETNQFFIFSSEGQLLHTLAREKNWALFGTWLNNEQLIILSSKPDESRPLVVEYPRELLLINLKTGERKVLPPNYPDIDKGSIFLMWGGSGTTVYDPSLTRVVYAASIEDIGLGYVLWDVPGARKIMHVPVADGGDPVWFHDGTKFLLNGHDGEFYLVSRDGEVSQVTYMNPVILDGITQDANGESHYSYYYDFSPDGKMASLWLQTLVAKTTHLAILDLEKREIKDLCIQAGYDPMKLEYVPIPVWSPDGKYLLVEAASQTKGESEVLLVDVEANTAYPVATNRGPVGWLALSEDS
jgi:hypothetical protein